MRTKLICLALLFGMPITGFAAQCAERPGGLEYLGRSADKSESYWISATTAGNFRLSAPGVTPIDTWSAAGNSLHFSASPVVKDDYNGYHYLDRMNPDGSFNCLLHSRNQTNPLLPPTWRPPARPELPEAIRPQLPDRPIAIRPQVPARPIVVQPELPVRPPVTPPDRPELPTGKTVVVEASGTLYEIEADTFQNYCPSSPAPRSGTAGAESPARTACPELANALRQAPLTPGRDLLADTRFNAWVDTTFMRSKDRRGVAEATDSSGTLSVGADYRLDSGVAAGMMLSARQQDTQRFWGYATTDANGWLIGPYAALPVGERWSLFANVSLGETRRNHTILSLTGNSSAFQYSATLNAQGDYAIGQHEYLRPKLGINYLNEAAREYQLNGLLLNRNISVVVDSKRRDTGQIQGSVEYGGRLESGKRLIVPYMELGAIYNYLAKYADDPKWQGLVRAGTRMRVGQSMQLDFNASYQSLGVRQLDIWDIRLFASWAFD